MTSLEKLNKKKLFWSSSAFVFLLILFFYEVPSEYSGIKIMMLITTPFIVLLSYAVLGLVGTIILGIGKIVKDWLFR